MKRVLYISILVLCFIVLVSCSSTGRTDRTQPTITLPSLEIDLEAPLTRIIIPSQIKRNTEQEQEHISAWESYMKDKHSLNLDLAYTNRNTASNEIIINDLEAIAEEGGFIYIDYYSDLKLLAESGLIQPINEYIDNTESLRGIDKSMYGGFTDSEGNIWAVPLYEETYLTPRVYDANWLAASGMELPKTIDDFYEYAKYIANNDPDRDGEKNTYITWYSYGTFTSDFKDIFKAFGCYVDSSPGLLAYNPLKGKYEIAAFNENFEGLMMYIKKLKDEYLIINATKATREDYANKDFKIGTTNSRFFFNSNEEMYAFSLTGPNDRYFQERSMVPALAVINGTTDVTEKLNTLYSILMESSDIKWDLLYGIKGTDYYDKGDHYEVYRQADHLEMLTPIEILTMFKEITYIRKPVLYEGMELSEDYIERVTKALAINDMAESMSEPNMYYSIPYSKMKDYQQLFELNIDIVGYGDALFRDILVNNIPVDEAVETFRLKMEELGIIEAVKKLNVE